MRNKGGRPSKFSVDTVVAIAYHLGRGYRLESAAESAGIGASTIWRWVQAGRAGDPRFRALATLAGEAGFGGRESLRNSERIAEPSPETAGVSGAE